jgi:hypothetical protein
MERLFGIILAGALLLLLPTVGGGDALAQDPFDEDLVINSVAIKAAGAADYEQIMDRLRDALVNSDDPVRNRMAQSWKLVRQANTMPNGDVIYVHLIEPVSGADYSIMQTLYDEFPEERQALYETYTTAFSAALGAAGGDIVLDMSR